MHAFIPTSSLVSTAVAAIKHVHTRIRASVDQDQRLRYAKTRLSTRDGKGKDALVIDLIAENACRDLFQTEYRSDVFVIGEESLPLYQTIPATETGGPYVLTDMIDGTDLLEMGFQEWCSAIVIYDPKKPEVLGSVVGLATGEIYYASAAEEGAYVYRTPYNPARAHFVEKVPGPSKFEDIHKARICWYGQKSKNFASIAKRRKLFSLFETLDSGRIYNLGGNPMMAKLIDRSADEAGHVLHQGVDVVFDLEGQHLHDVVPGAYLALKAGAVLYTETGESINAADLAQRLRNPNNTMTYVLAATPELARTLIDALSE